MFSMLLAALTGGIGSGKSLVGSLLKENGFTVIDIDAIVYSLYEVNEVRKKLLELFGSLDKHEIASQAFAHAGKRRELENLLQPRALRVLKRRLLKFSGQEIVFVEVPLLFEAGLEREFDVVIAVFAPKKERLERLVKRGIARKDALNRMRCQLPEKEKVKKADFIIDNGNSIEATRKQVELMVKKLVGK